MTWEVYIIETGKTIATCACEREAQAVADRLDPGCECLGVRPC